MSVVRSLSGSPKNNEKKVDTILLVVCLGLGAGMGVSIAYLIVNGLWQFALVLLAALPAFILLHRYPLAGLFIWLLLTPFLVTTDGGVLRKMYWVIHRVLPPLAIAIILLSSGLGIRKRAFPKLGWPELFMVGYLIVSQLSIIYLSSDVQAMTFYLYDHVLIPICLYLLIRLVSPTEQDMKYLLPVLIFTLVSQSIIGLLSWIMPQILPVEWLGRVGTRTTGSLQSYSVFTSTIVFCSLLILQSAFNHKLSNFVSQIYKALFILTIFMGLISFSRGSWLGFVVVVLGLMYLYPKLMLRLGVVVFLVGIIVVSVGVFTSYFELAQRRFYSEQSEQTALSRLPMLYASYRMFEAKPLFGWGYGNFDEVDRQFQERVGDLVSAEKDHASHNLYMGLVAEQGAVGFALFLLPMFWWLMLTIKALPQMPSEGFWSRKLVIILWLVIAFHIVVNNFSHMSVVYGLGMWWITLGFIGAIIYPYTLSDNKLRVSKRVRSRRKLEKPRPHSIPDFSAIKRSVEGK